MISKVRVSRKWIAALALATILSATVSVAAAAQNSAVVSGRVIDASTGEPIAAAQVAIQGTNRATVTNDNGQFRFDRLGTGEVTVKVVRIGYQSATQAINPGAAPATIRLTRIAVAIDELIITGTPGATEKRALGNSVSTIEAAEVTRLQPVSDVGNLLQGRAAGVAVTEQAGAAGGGSRIMVRGPGSLAFQGNPVIYVDGVRINDAPSTGPSFGQAGGAGAPNVVSRLNDINPQDIESIEILKGPAAATLYGTQASAGVIQIITKKGQPGPMRVTAQMRQGTNWLHDIENRIPVTYGQMASGEIVSTNFIKEEAELGNPLFRKGHLQEYSLDISGGTDAIRYYSGAELQKNEGVIPINGSDRFNGRLNLTVRPSQKFDADIGFATTRGETTLYHALYLGSFIYGQPAFRNTVSRGFLVAPVEAYKKYFNYTQDVKRNQANVTLAHRPYSWLSHRLSAGQDYTDQTLEILTPVIPDEFSPFFSPTARRGGKSVDAVKSTYTTMDYSATGVAKLGSRLEASTSAGLQYYRTFIEAQSLSGQQFPAPGVSTISSAAIRSSAEGVVEDVTVGIYAQEQLAWKNRFFLTGAIRADDNSAFGQEFDLITYPKVSASWVISEEPFWNLGFVNALKLRAAYGESGQQPSAFASIRTYSPIAGENDLPAGTPQSPGNPNLGPERGTEVEIGFETSMINNRLGVDFTYYNRKTRDVILQTAVAPSTGYSGTQFINAGQIDNRGFEMLVRGSPIQTRNLMWDLTLNVGKNSNELVDIGSDVEFLPVGFLPNRHQEGFPIDAYFRKKVVSADIVNGRATNAMCDGGTGKQGVMPGGAATPCAQAPYLYLGKPYFDWNGSVTSSLNMLRRLTLGAVFDFRRNGAMFESLRYWNCASLLNHEIVFYPERYDPVEVAECQLGLDYVGTTRIQDNSYTKLRELSLSYQVPESFAHRLNARRATITLAGRNLATWTKYDGLDPETFSSTNYLLSNHTELVLPLPRTFMATVRVEY